MLKKIGQAVVFGLFCAILILFVAPFFQGKNVAFSFFNLNRGEVASYNNAVSIASPAVVNIYTRSFSQNNEGTFDTKNLGSGVIMSSNGYILTNKHVIENADQIVVALQNGLISTNAKLVGDDSLTDLAVLKIEADNLPVIPQNQERTVRVGDIVLAIGNPLNLGQSVTQGIVSAIGRNQLENGRQNFIQTDVSINQGNSGGALINSLGELIGINTLRFGKNANEQAEGLNFAIPINLANQIMQKIIKDGRVIRAYFGVSTDLIDTAKIIGYEKGVIISSVTENGPAAKAGIEAGDLVLKIGDVEALSPSQMMEALAEMKPYSTVKVLIQRNGQLLEFDVTITELQSQ